MWPRKRESQDPRSEETVTRTRADALPHDSHEEDPEPTLTLVDSAHYQIDGEHARGGLGRILLARDHRLGRIVAIKELVANDAEHHRRFVREARLTARLQHPAIVPVYEAGRWPDGKPFYAMKLVSGRALKDLIAERTTLDQRIALLPNMIAVADAIAYAHGVRIIHRDIKPSNIMVGPFGETVVVDWGLAKPLGEPELIVTDDDKLLHSGEGHCTEAGTVLGTPAYMAPEQALGADVDERADVYSLGAVLYHLCTGSPPYAGNDAISVIRAVVEGPPLPLTMRQAGVARDLVTVVEKAMARNPPDRYATAKELVEDLKRFQTGQLVTANTYS